LTAAEAPIDDGQIAEVADAIDAQQVETARVAMDRSSDADVTRFARDLVVDDSNAPAAVLRAAHREKAALQPTIVVERFESQARDLRAWLLSEPRASFDRDFLSSEIKEQTRQLDLLDHVLIPGARDETLQAELKQRRYSVEHRLREAQRLSHRFPPP
jgi:predicted outer membrane protein